MSNNNNNTTTNNNNNNNSRRLKVLLNQIRSSMFDTWNVEVAPPPHQTKDSCFGQTHHNASQALTLNHVSMCAISKNNKRLLAPNFVLRFLEPKDYSKGFLQLLSQLTSVGDIKEEDFTKQLEQMHKDTYFIVVVEDLEKGKIAASATLIVERKFTHGCSKVGHIEDVVVDEYYRGKQLGYFIIERLKQIAKEQGCYKTILDCSEKNIQFYEKCDFVRKEIQMRHDHHH